MYKVSYCHWQTCCCVGWHLQSSIMYDLAEEVILFFQTKTPRNQVENKPGCYIVSSASPTLFLKIPYAQNTKNLDQCR